MKIAKLRFQISDYTGVKDAAIGVWEEDHEENKEKLYGPSDVVGDVNKALDMLEKMGHEIIDVRTDFVTVHSHNNGGCATVFEHVTILYK